MNPLMLTDSYNITHWEMRDDVTKDIAYFYNRQSPLIFFGFAGLVNKLFNQFISEKEIEIAALYAEKNNIKFDKDTWMKLNKKYNGRLGNVLTVEQVPEFCWYPSGTPLAKLYNHVDGFAELVTYFEGFLTKAYYPSMCLTNVYKYKEAGLVNIHNFGYRGHRSQQDAMWCDLAFALVYPGTDSFHINELIHNSAFLYGSEFEPYKDLIAELKPVTIRAASHKVIQSYTDEESAIHNIIQKCGGHTVAFPIDTYGAQNFIDKNHVKLAIDYAYLYGTNIMFRIDSGDRIHFADTILEYILAAKQDRVLQNNAVKLGIIISGNMNLDRVINIRDVLSHDYGDIKIDEYLFFGIGGDIYNDITRDKVGMVCKLGWSHKTGPTMKIVQDKESIPGDFKVSFHAGNYVVSKSKGYDSPNNKVFLDMLKQGKVFGKDYPLIIAQDILKDIDLFKEGKKK